MTFPFLPIILIGFLLLDRNMTLIPRRKTCRNIFFHLHTYIRNFQATESRHIFQIYDEISLKKNQH